MPSQFLIGYCPSNLPQFFTIVGRIYKSHPTIPIVSSIFPQKRKNLLTSSKKDMVSPLRSKKSNPTATSNPRMLFGLYNIFSQFVILNYKIGHYIKTSRENVQCPVVLRGI